MEKARRWQTHFNISSVMTAKCCSVVFLMLTQCQRVPTPWELQTAVLCMPTERKSLGMLGKAMYGDHLSLSKKFWKLLIHTNPKLQKGGGVQFCRNTSRFWLWELRKKDRFQACECAGLFISPSGISGLDCATTKTDTAERNILVGRESLQLFFCTRGLGILPDSTARG